MDINNSFMHGALGHWSHTSMGFSALFFFKLSDLIGEYWWGGGGPLLQNKKSLQTNTFILWEKEARGRPFVNQLFFWRRDCLQDDLRGDCCLRGHQSQVTFYITLYQYQYRSIVAKGKKEIIKSEIFCWCCTWDMTDDCLTEVINVIDWLTDVTFLGFSSLPALLYSIFATGF